MTASAVGRYWRQATPEQQQRLQEEFKTLLVRTYSGALTQVKDQTVQLKPMRSKPEDKDVVVRTEVRGKGDPVQLDYRLEKAAGGWKIYDVNVLGVWLVENYRNSFAQEIGASGIDGLIGKLAEQEQGRVGQDLSRRRCSCFPLTSPSPRRATRCACWRRRCPANPTPRSRSTPRA